MAAEIQAAAVCQVCGERGQSAKDCWYHAIKECEKGQRQGTRTKDEDDKRKGVCNNCDGGGESASNCLKERESSKTSYSGGGDPLCLTYTDDQLQWITTMEKLDLWWNSRTSLCFCQALVLHVGCGRTG